MTAGVVSRSREVGAVNDFLTSAQIHPSGLVVEGEPGIGKTSLWVAATERARDRGFRVLSAAVPHAESKLAYTALADLLRDVESSVLDELPEVQRVAVDRVLLRADADDGPATEQNVVTAAFLSVLERLEANGPVVVAIDDVQWLGPSTEVVVASAARRMKGRVGVLVTERSGPEGGNAASWLQLGRPDRVNRIRVGPMSLGALHAVVSARLGRALPRPTMTRICEVSGGNPFYALELARAVSDGPAGDAAALPSTLSAVVRSRVGSLDDEARHVLLAAASAAAPTVEMVAQACGTAIKPVVEVLERVEAKGIIGIDGNQVRFSHPLLARGVYAEAGPARRRAMHRTLAEIVEQPELRARHLALAATSGDPAVVEALDAAADVARARGAPADAAELMDFAMRLGGDTPLRRIKAADHHLQAGVAEQARAVLEPAIKQLPRGVWRAKALKVLAETRMYNNSFVQAAELLKEALEDAKSEPAVLVSTLLLLSFAQLNAGEYDESLHHVSQALTLAQQLRVPPLTSQALAMSLTVGFMCGQGVDEPGLRRALELEDPNADAPIAFRASVVNALILAWTGRLEEAHTQMQAVRRDCIERGANTHMIFVALHGTLIDIWRGDFGEAALTAEDAMERAEQLAGDHPLVIAKAVRALVAAYTGREHDARADARAAIEGADRCGSPRLADRAIMSLGFLEVSLGEFAEALRTLQPLVSRFNDLPGTEIVNAAFAPDAVEAMVALGRLADAEPLIEALERNGSRLDRSWMLAIGARGRSMWLAAQGDIAAATRKAGEAMTEHDRLPMPFERARTQLLLGQLERRQRRKDVAAANLSEALRAFEAIGAQLWAARARAELARTKVGWTRDAGLTPSERRVAELAASGLTNRDIAAALFISLKTVEANLARIYRKLGIRSRAELGRRLDQQT
jgi:DNA-binding CsgD family transcriptional regulator